MNQLRKSIIIILSLVSFLVLFYLANELSARHLIKKYLDNYTYTPVNNTENINSQNYKDHDWEIHYLDSHELMWLSYEKLHFVNDTLLSTQTKTDYFGSITPLMYMLNVFNYTHQDSNLYLLKNNSLFLIADSGKLLNKGILRYSNSKLIQTGYLRP